MAESPIEMGRSKLFFSAVMTQLLFILYFIEFLIAEINVLLSSEELCCGQKGLEFQVIGGVDLYYRGYVPHPRRLLKCHPQLLFKMFNRHSTARCDKKNKK